MASLPPLSPFGRAVQDKTSPVDTTLSTNPALVGDGGEQYIADGSQQDETSDRSESTQGLTMNGEPWDNLYNEAIAANQSIDFNPQPIEGNDIFNQFVNDIASQPLDADAFAPMASQQQWDGQQVELFPPNYSQGGWQYHGPQVYDGNLQQPLLPQHGYDDGMPYGSYPDMQYNSQQTVFMQQYPAANDQGRIGGHGRHDSGYQARQRQHVPQTSSGNMYHDNGSQFGAQHAIHSQQTMAMGTNDMHQQFQQPSWNGNQQPRTNEHRPASPLSAPRPQRHLPDFVENYTDAQIMGHDGRHQTSTGNFDSYHDSPRYDERQHQEMVPQRHANHFRQPAMPSFNDSAPRSYRDGIQQLQQGSINTGKSQASSSRPSRESTIEAQAVPPQVTIPPNCPVENLTNYSLDFVRPPQKIIKKAADEHWIDYPGFVQEFFTSPFPEYCLTPEDPNDFLPAAIHIKTLSPAQMLEYHARAPQHRDLMHQFIVPRMTGYPNELPGDTPAIKQKKFKNNTISMRQQRLREQNGQFMGDAKISRVAKKEKHKSLTKVFMEILPKTNGASLLHGTIGQIMRSTDGRWFTRASFTGGGLNGDHDFPLRQPMAIPKPLADELKKAGLPEPDLHEHLRQNEEIWKLFYPKYFSNGKQLPPIEENRRKTQFVKGRGRKAAAPAPARGTKRQRTAEPATQQTSDVSSSVQAPAIPPPPQQQRTLENLQSPATQQFFASIHSSRNQQRVEHQAGPQSSYLPSASQHGEDDHHDRVKKHRTGPAAYDEQQEISTPNSAASGRGSLLQQLNHHHRGDSSTRINVPTHVARHQQQIRNQQHGQVAQIVNPGWDHIVGTAISDERARQAQAEAAVINHNLRQDGPINQPIRQEQSLMSSSPFEPAGNVQGQSTNLGSGAVGEESSPVRYDLKSMRRIPIGGAQWQPEYSSPPMSHGLATTEVQHLPSSPPATGRAEVDLSVQEPQIPQLPSSPPQSGLNDSGYFPGGLAQGDHGDSESFPQGQVDDFEFGLDDIDLSQVSNFNFSLDQGENLQQDFSANTEASQFVTPDQDGEFNFFDLSQVSEFNTYSQGEYSETPDFEHQSQPEYPAVQSEPSQIQDQEDDGAASPQRPAKVFTTKESVVIDLSEEDEIANPPSAQSDASDNIDLGAEDWDFLNEDEMADLPSAQPDASDNIDLGAEDWDFLNEDDGDSSEEEVVPRKMSWSELNGHASAHRAQAGDDIFESCEQCQQYREAMGAWCAEKTKKKVKGEAIGYGTMTQESRMESHAKMMRRAGLTKKARNREIFEGM